MIKGIAFDKDGTLLEYAPFWVTVARKTIEQILDKRNCLSDELIAAMLKSIGADEGINGLLCHGTYTEIYKKLSETLSEYGYDDIPLEEDEVSAAFSQSIKYGEIIPACDNIAGFMRNLKDKNIVVAVITTDNYEITEYSLKELGIIDYIDKIYADDGKHPTKPDPYYMECFCRDFSLDKSEVIMVGDTLTDMRFAKNSGVKAVGVTKTESAKNTLLTMNDAVVYDISCVTGVIDTDE